MIAANPIFNSLTSILNRPNPRRKASMALSRIMTQLDLRDLPYEQGVDFYRRPVHTEDRADPAES